MKTSIHVIDTESICRLLAVSRSDSDPRSTPAISLILGHGVSPAQLDHVLWPDISLSSEMMLIRAHSRYPTKTVELTLLLTQQLIPLIRQHARPSRPFGKPTKDGETIQQLLKRLLTRAGLHNVTAEEIVTWSKNQRDEVRKSIVTAA